MDIAVIGASGAVGRAVCGQLLASGTLGPGDRLQLVGHRGGASETGIFGLRIDLLDAYAQTAPQVEPVLDPERIKADIVIMVAGSTPSDDPHTVASRDAVAQANLPVFESYAQAIAQHGRGDELVIIQSNPVELAVDVFARHLGPRRVLGAGAYSDTQRFRREIAAGFAASAWGQGSRPIVTGYMLGEHGPAIVPMWSTLQAHGVDRRSWDEYLRFARGGRTLADLPAHAAHARDRVAELLADQHGEDAFAFVAQLPPDVRAVVKPWFAHWSGRTSTATAHSVVDMVQELRRGHRIVLPLQVACTADDWPGAAGVIGLAVDIDLAGWHFSVPLDLADDEREALLAAIGSVRQRLDAWQS